MSVTDYILILLIIALLTWAVYDTFILDHRQGKTRLAIPLLRCGRVDSAIFVGLTGILIYNNMAVNCAILTNGLLGTLALIAIYLSWLRVPKIRFKSTGFFFAGGWTEYNHIKAMNLSEDGVLIVNLEKRKLLICVNNINNLEKIYMFMHNNQQVKIKCCNENY